MPFQRRKVSAAERHNRNGTPRFPRVFRGLPNKNFDTHRASKKSNECTSPNASTGNSRPSLQIEMKLKIAGCETFLLGIHLFNTDRGERDDTHGTIKFAFFVETKVEGLLLEEAKCHHHWTALCQAFDTYCQDVKRDEFCTKPLCLIHVSFHRVRPVACQH